MPAQSGRFSVLSYNKSSGKAVLISEEEYCEFTAHK